MLTMSHTDPCFTSTLCCPRRTYEAGLCQTHSRGTAVPSRWLVHLLLPAGTLQGVLSSKRPGSEVKRTLKPPHPSDQSLKAPDPPVSKSLPEPPDFDFPHLCKIQKDGSLLISAMETGIIHPSSSPIVAGFFFVDKGQITPPLLRLPQPQRYHHQKQEQLRVVMICRDPSQGGIKWLMGQLKILV
ncbi:uncharacterized protein LOC120784426 isoform X3 [Xiphias gladius]|uniref:uncharacterized protein LOC120784426 isoform X3 n=1 Tax=Xiphias gladius TaxID=8245 RepID=UPI001A981DB5|nr:uncharacterized protein LOC120784426 isoform X3 [Xiphias gladius]